MSSFNLADLFEGVVDAVPDRVALVCGDADGIGVRRTFAELDARANKVGHVLAGRGVTHGQHVGIGLRNGHHFVELLLGCYKLGAVPVNVNYRYAAEELRYLLADADAVAVFVEPELVAVVDELRPALPLLGHVETPGTGWDAEVDAASPDRLDGGARSSDDLYLLYTGGTTGMPKGVMWRHEDIFFASLGGNGSPRFGIDRLDRPEDVGAWATRGSALTPRMPLCPLMHGGAQWLTLQALLNGGCAVLDTSHHYDPEVALDLLGGERVAMTFVIGDAVTRPLVDRLAADPERWDLGALQVFGSGGAILSPTVKRQLAELLPGVKVVDTFGASESGGQGRLVSGGDGEPPRLRADAGARVFDEELRPVAAGSGMVGRLGKRGHIPYGYYKDPEKTAATFPVIEGERWTLPGDLAEVLEDGTILLLGRGSVSINTGGEKVFPEEVEKVVKAHPAVLDALVVGVPDERFGQRVSAVVALRPGVDWPGDAALSSFCHEHISGYKVPRCWTIVGRVPRLPTGKPDYRAAVELAGVSD